MFARLIRANTLKVFETSFEEESLSGFVKAEWFAFLKASDGFLIRFLQRVVLKSKIRIKIKLFLEART